MFVLVGPRLEGLVDMRRSENFDIPTVYSIVKIRYSKMFDCIRF